MKNKNLTLDEFNKALEDNTSGAYHATPVTEKTVAQYSDFVVRQSYDDHHMHGAILVHGPNQHETHTAYLVSPFKKNHSVVALHHSKISDMSPKNRSLYEENKAIVPKLTHFFENTPINLRDYNNSKLVRNHNDFDKVLGEYQSDSAQFYNSHKQIGKVMQEALPSFPVLEHNLQGTHQAKGVHKVSTDLEIKNQEKLSKDLDEAYTSLQNVGQPYAKTSRNKKLTKALSNFSDTIKYDPIHSADHEDPQSRFTDNLNMADAAKKLAPFTDKKYAEQLKFNTIKYTDLYNQYSDQLPKLEDKYHLNDVVEDSQFNMHNINHRGNKAIKMNALSIDLGKKLDKAYNLNQKTEHKIDKVVKSGFNPQITGHAMGNDHYLTNLQGDLIRNHPSILDSDKTTKDDIKAIKQETIQNEPERVHEDLIKPLNHMHKLSDKENYVEALGAKFLNVSSHKAPVNIQQNRDKVASRYYSTHKLQSFKATKSFDDLVNHKTFHKVVSNLDRQRNAILRKRSAKITRPVAHNFAQAAKMLGAKGPLGFKFKANSLHNSMDSDKPVKHVQKKSELKQKGLKPRHLDRGHGIE